VEYNLTQTLACQQIGLDTYTAEDWCNVSVVGFDSAYFAFGALGVLYIMQIYSIRMAIERLKEDSRWLVMAMLLRSTAQEHERLLGNSRRPKLNTTGTSYLEEGDFNVNFNDPRFVHTRV
jgi:hypothetical protein